MKKNVQSFGKVVLVLLLTFNFQLSTFFCFAQAPQSFSYQAVVRDAQGNILQNQSVSFKFSIIENSATGNVVYAETQAATTNNLGLVVLAIGNGTVLQGTFSTIQWGNASHFFKVELDVNGGSNFVNMGTTQLLSVPYALYSENAGNVQTYTAGNGISITGNVIDNTAPDQPVVLNGTGATTVTGTYPIFTISSTDINTTYSAGTGLTLTGTTFSHNAHTGDVSGTTALTVTGIQGKAVSPTAPAPSQVLQYDGSNWSPTQPSNLINAGNGLNYSGNTLNSVWTQTGVNIYNNNAGRVGIGMNAPTGKLSVQGDTSNVLFEVKDKDGLPVFVVYQDSVQVFVDASGFKANKGSFAVNPKAQQKASNTHYLCISPDSSRIYTENPLGGFGVSDISGGSAESYLHLTPENYFIGHNAGIANTMGLHNLFLGYEAGQSSWGGSRNILIGYRSGYNSSSSNFNDNIIIGDSAGINNNSFSNIFIGNNAGQNTIAAYENVYIGMDAGKNGAFGQYNTYIGTSAGKNATGGLNTFIGCQSGLNNTTGENNVFIGCSAGFTNNAGSGNTFIGEYSGCNLNAIGNFNNCAALGYDSPIDQDNMVYLGNTSTMHIVGAVNFAPVSDKRVKKNIKEDVPGLNFIKKLKPVTYNLDVNKMADLMGEDYTIDKNGNRVKKDIPDFIRKAREEKSKIIYTGFLAQDVEQAAQEVGYDFSGVDKPQNEQALYGLRYAEFVVPLVKAVQEQQEIIETLQKQIFDLQKEIEQLKSNNTNK